MKCPNCGSEDIDVQECTPETEYCPGQDTEATCQGCSADCLSVYFEALNDHIINLYEEQCNEST